MGVCVGQAAGWMGENSHGPLSSIGSRSIYQSIVHFSLLAVELCQYEQLFLTEILTWALQFQMCWEARVVLSTGDTGKPHRIPSSRDSKALKAKKQL